MLWVLVVTRWARGTVTLKDGFVASSGLDRQERSYAGVDP